VKPVVRCHCKTEVLTNDKRGRLIIHPPPFLKCFLSSVYGRIHEQVYASPHMIKKKTTTEIAEIITAYQQKY